MTFVDVHPFSRQPDGSEVVIGLAASGVYLALPPDAVEVIDLLAAGNSIEEARAIHRQRHGEDADVEGLVAALASHGFLSIRGAAARAGDGEAPVAQAAPPPQNRFHFTAMPRRWAERLFSPPAIAAVAALIVAGVAIWWRRPDLVPGWRALVFDNHAPMLLILLMVAGLGSTVLHEMAHLTAARARGVDSRLGIGNRLWILVAETDLTGLWQLPRRQRYLPLLAGLLVDGATASLLVILLAGADLGRPALSPAAAQFVQALALLYVLRIVWQAFFFVRTDLYYVYANLFGCKDLMNDTRRYLRQLAARTRGRSAEPGLDGLPAVERRAVRLYAAFWVGGRLLAFAVLVTITLPAMWAYTRQVASDLANGPGSDLVAYVESFVIAVLSLSIMTAGFVLWIRSWGRQRSSPDG